MAIPDIYQEGIDEAIQDACKSALREALHAPDPLPREASFRARFQFIRYIDD